MNITHLRHIALFAPQLSRSRDFFVDAWGLQIADEGAAGTFLRTSRAEPFQLVLIPGRQRGVARVAFGVASRREVDAAADELSRAGVALVSEPSTLDTPGGGYGLRFRDPDDRCVELSSDVGGTGGSSARHAAPRYLAHAVFNTPNIDRATAFYTEVLGFRLSDWSEHVMSFLRCDHEHHAVAFNAAPHASVNHTSWQMASIDELFRAQGRLRAAGVPLMWGTGRHAPGKQVFNYFVEPSGYVVEYIADGEAITDEASWQPQVYRREPAAMDLWNTSGPPSAEIRSAMLGEPDPGG